MNEKDIQDSENTNSNWLMRDKEIKETTFQFDITDEKQAAECSNDILSTEKPQIEAFRAKTYDDNINIQDQGQKNMEGNDCLTESLGNSSVQEASHVPSSVKKLQRPALPEEEIVFKFGAAPKPTSYQRRLAIEKNTLQEATALHQSASMIDSISNSNSIYESDIFSDIETDSTINEVGVIKKLEKHHLTLANITSRAKESHNQELTIQHDQKYCSSDFRELLGANNSDEVDSYIHDLDNLNDYKRSNLDIIAQNNCSNNNTEVLKQSITYNDSIRTSHPSLPNTDSGTQSTKKGMILMPRLPSKKPRIKKPFPDASSTLTSSQSFRRELKPLEQDSNFIRSQSFKNNCLEIGNELLVNRGDSRDNLKRNSRQITPILSRTLSGNSLRSMKLESQGSNVDEHIKKKILPENYRTAETNGNTNLSPNNFDKRVMKNTRKQIEHSQVKMGNTIKTPASVAACIKIVESCNVFVDMAKECEEKTKIIENQKTHIIELENLTDFSEKKINQLEKGVSISKQRFEQLTNLSKKLQKNLNELHTFQKYIEEQGNDTGKRFSLVETLRKSLAQEVSELKNEFQAATLRLDNFYKGLASVTKDILKCNKDLSDRNEELLGYKKDAISQYQNLEKENRELRDRSSKSESENKILHHSIEKLKSHNNEIEALKMNAYEKLRKLEFAEQNSLVEKMCLEKKLQDVMVSLNNDKTKISNELDCEKIKKKSLEKELEDRRKDHFELQNLVRKIPEEITLEFKKEIDLLKKSLDLAATTQTNLEQIINDLKLKNKEQTAYVIEIFDTISSRLDISLKKQQSHDLSLEPINGILMELQNGLSHLRSDQEMQARLNTTISSLQNSNEILLKEGDRLQSEKNSTERELDQLRSKHLISEENLRAKTSELNEASATIEENPLLKTKIKHLENDNEKLAEQLETFKQKVSDLKEKNTEACRIKDQRIVELQQTVCGAESRNKVLEEKNDCMIKELENKKDCQELIKMAETSKATLKLKLETEVKNLDQKLRNKSEEVEDLKHKLEIAQSESSKVRLECQKLQTANDTRADTTLELRTELYSFKDQFLRQTARLQMLERYSLEPQTSENLKARLRSVLMEVSELRILFQAIKKDNSQLLDLFSSDRQQIDKRLANLYDKHKENEFVGIEDLSLQESLEILEASLEDPTLFDKDKPGPQNLEIHKELHIQDKVLIPKTPEAVKCNESIVDQNSRLNMNLEQLQCVPASEQRTVKPSRSTQLENSNERYEGTSSSHRQPTNINPTILIKNVHHSNSQSPLSKEANCEMNNLSLDTCSQNKSNSSSLTDIEPIIEVFASVNGPEELSFEYEKARKLKKIGCNTCKSTSKLKISGQRDALGSSKHSLHQDDSEEIASGQNYDDITENFGQNLKRQKSSHQKSLSATGKSRKRSGLSTPAKNPLKGKIRRSVHQNPLTPSHKTDFTFQAGFSGQLVKQKISNTEPTESNVKQRRQEINKYSAQDVDYKCGIKFGTSPCNEAKMSQTSGPIDVDSMRLPTKVTNTLREKRMLYTKDSQNI